MKPQWWALEAHSGWLLIRTPWFSVVLSEWGKFWNELILWRGIGFWWSPNRDAREGEFYFNREFVLVTETISFMDAQVRTA